MYLEDIHILNFRNLQEIRLQFARGLNVIYGPNAQGKTNLIEAIHMLVTGRSFRARSERELVPWLAKDYEATLIRATVGRGGSRDRFVLSFNLTEKHIAVNGEPIRRLGELIGKINAVLFTPATLHLVRGLPQDRRRFLDLCLSQVSRAYLRDLQRYDLALRQRNALLKQHRDRPHLAKELEPYDAQLAESGAAVIRARASALEFLSRAANEHFTHFGARGESMGLKYVGSVESEAPTVDNSTLRQQFLEKLAHTLREDIQHGVTSIGPHRDDFRFLLNNRDLRTFGSQGQQRACVLALKFAELDFIATQTGEVPLLFLDDLMSELDEQRRAALLTNLPKNVQCFLTTTDLDFVTVGVAPGGVYYVIDGAVQVQTAGIK